MLKEKSFLLAFVTQDSISTTNIHYMSGLAFNLLVETHILAIRINTTKKSEERFIGPHGKILQITK